MDGLDMWAPLLRDEPSPRNLMLHNIDDHRGIASVRVGDWKFTRGTTYGGRWDGWYGPSGRAGRLPPYDTAAVRSSAAAVAAKVSGVELPETDQELKRLREDAEVKCEDGRKRKKCDLRWQVRAGEENSFRENKTRKSWVNPTL